MTPIRILVAFVVVTCLSVAPIGPQTTAMIGPQTAFAGETCRICITIDLIVIGGKYCYEGSCSGGDDAPDMPHWIP
jgi:hypothetical protein